MICDPSRLTRRCLGHRWQAPPLPSYPAFFSFVPNHRRNDRRRRAVRESRRWLGRASRHRTSRHAERCCGGCANSIRPPQPRSLQGTPGSNSKKSLRASRYAEAIVSTEPHQRPEDNATGTTACERPHLACPTPHSQVGVPQMGCSCDIRGSRERELLPTSGRVRREALSVMRQRERLAAGSCHGSR